MADETTELTHVLDLAPPRSCSNCDAETGIRWHVQAFTSQHGNHPRVSAYLGCDTCGETTSLIEYAEEQLERAMAIAEAGPAVAVLTAWNAIVPCMRPRTLEDMGEDQEVDLTALRTVLDGMSPSALLKLSVVAQRLTVEAHQVRDAKLLAAMPSAKMPKKSL